MHLGSGAGGNRRGLINERRAERALRDRIQDTPWLFSVRNPTEYEDSAGIDLACRTEGAGEIYVQVKSSERQGSKFRGSYRLGSRGAVPIAVIVVREDESNRELGDRIVAAVGALRDEIVAEGRGVWTTRKEREFVVRRALRFPTSDLDVGAAVAFMELAENLSEPWPLWLQAFRHGESDGNACPLGIVYLDTDLGFPIRLVPSRCKKQVERVLRAVGPNQPWSLVTVPIHFPNDPDPGWIETMVCGKAGAKYQRLYSYVMMAPGRNLRQP